MIFYCICSIYGYILTNIKIIIFVLYIYICFSAFIYFHLYIDIIYLLIPRSTNSQIMLLFFLIIQYYQEIL